MRTDTITLIADPQVLAVPIQENHEPLVNARDFPELLIGPSPEIENNLSYTYMRKIVLTKLQTAQNLLPSHLRLCLYEGLRTLSLQKLLFEKEWQKIKTLHPQFSQEEIYNQVTKLVSPLKTLDGAFNIPPHATGAAVDVYLVDTESNQPVDMGILAKDWMDDPEGKLSLTDSEFISFEAVKHRSILCHVMREVGFVNYPTEYWHWSYGDRYWAFIKNEPYAFFDIVDLAR
jgi:D-alanyl-D-alanine dipeptidase